MVLDYKGRNDIANWTCINYLQYVQSRWGLRTPSMLTPFDKMAIVSKLYGQPSYTYIFGDEIDIKSTA